MRNYKNTPIPPAIQKAADEYIGYPHEVDEGVSVSMRRDAFAHGMMAQNEKIAAYIRECMGPVQQCVDNWDASRGPRTSSYHYDRGKIRGYKDILGDLESGGLDEYMSEKEKEK